MKIKLNEYQAEKYVDGLVTKRLRTELAYQQAANEVDKAIAEAKVVADAWDEIESKYEVTYS